MLPFFISIFYTLHFSIYFNKRFKIEINAVSKCLFLADSSNSRNMSKTKQRSFLITANIVTLVCFFLYAFVVPEAKPELPPQEKTLTLGQAQTLHQNYDKSASTIQARLEGIFLDRETINDITSILNAMPEAGGVRLYFGKTDDGKAQNIIVPTNKEKQDDSNFMLRSEGSVAICPTICDTESPLVKQ